MTLTSMVVSRDWQEISVLECILGGLHIGVDVEAHPERARAKLSTSKIDAMIVDCDLDGAAEFLRELQNGLINQSVPVVVLRGSRSRNPGKIQPALFEFQKPISVEQAVHTLSAARNMILDGRLRYHRQTLHVPVSVSCGSRKRGLSTSSRPVLPSELTQARCTKHVPGVTPIQTVNRNQ